MSYSAIESRRKTVGVKLGSIMVGGGAPVVVQSMTNTDTADAEATALQVAELARAGSELVRLTVDRAESAAAVPAIAERLAKMNVSVPLIGDFHYNGHVLLAEYPECARVLAKYRINPGNVGFKEKKDRNFATMIEVAMKYNKAIRIGVNWGSLDQAMLASMMDDNAKSSAPQDVRVVMHEAIVRSGIQSALYAEELGLGRDKIIISAKCSEVQDVIAVYRLLSAGTDHALHLGLTEAGLGSKGIVSSTAALGILLQQGIGDTIRISLTPEPGGERIREVIVAQEILQCMGLRAFVPQVIACPGCGRTTSSVFQELAQNIQTYVRVRVPQWQKLYPGFETLTLAVMGCIVNGPGESKHADIGISLPGTGELPAAPVYIDGQKVMTLRGENIANQFEGIVEKYVARRWGAKSEQTLVAPEL